MKRIKRSLSFMVSVIVMGLLLLGSSVFVSGAQSQDAEQPLVYLNMEDITDGRLVNQADQKTYEIFGKYDQMESANGTEALQFDGISTYVNLGREYQVRDAFTITALINMSSQTTERATLLGTARIGIASDNYFTFNIQKSGRNLWYNVSNGGTGNTETNTVGLDQWQYVSIVGDKDTITVYVNGESVYQAAWNTTPLDVQDYSMDMMLGGSWNSEGTAAHPNHLFRGAMDEFRLYDVALSESEIKELAAMSGVEINLAAGLEKDAYSSKTSHADYPAYLAFDSNLSTFWAMGGTGEGYVPGWIQVDLGKEVSFNYAKVSQNNRDIKGWSIQVSDTGEEDGNWTTVAQGNGEEWSGITGYTSSMETYFPSVTSRFVRFYIESLNANNPAGIWEFELYNKVVDDIEILNPTEREIVQRDETEKGIFPVQVQCNNEDIDKLQVKAELTPGALKGKSTEWMDMTAEGNGRYSHELKLNSGGWYTLLVRGMKEDGTIIAEEEVRKIGVGDIFLTYGQSNSICYGEKPMASESDMVCSIDPVTAQWTVCRDPQPTNGGATGTGGSPWPVAGDYLAERLGVPIGFVSCGWGGASISELSPGNPSGIYEMRIKPITDLFPVNGFKAVLFHQGESDSAFSPSVSGYAETLTELIAAVRKDFGWDMPWMIANISISDQAKEPAENMTLLAQQLVADRDPAVYLGPYTDDMPNVRGQYRWDGTHFTVKGLTIHGTRWGQELCEQLYGLPEDSIKLTTEYPTLKKNVQVHYKVESFAQDGTENTNPIEIVAEYPEAVKIDTENQTITLVGDLPEGTEHVRVYAKTLIKGKTPLEGDNTTNYVLSKVLMLNTVIDKMPLQDLYNQSKDISQGDYPADVWEAFSDALANAETALKDQGADQAKVDEAYSILKDAIEKLDQNNPETISKNTLEYFLNSAKAHVENGDIDDCVQSVKDLFEEAIAESEAVMADENATRDEVMNATLKLVKAIHALDMKAADKTDLEMAVELGDMIDLSKYVEEGQKEFTDALAAAKEVLADGDALQGDVDTAWDALVTAMENLRLKADKDALEDHLDEAAGLDLSQYTEESAAAFRTALASAQAVFADETLSEADQQKVDDAVAALKEAKAGLAVAEGAGDGSETGQNSGDGSQGGNTGNDNNNDTPENSGNTSGTENGDQNNGNSKSKAAKTGDTAPITGMMMLVLVSGAAALAGSRRRVK